MTRMKDTFRVFVVRKRWWSAAACLCLAALIFAVVNRGNEDTQQLIDIMDQYQVKATFFVVGDWAEKYPESVKALHDAGHEVMNHSNTHAHYPQLSADEIVADLNACNDKVEQITGVRPTLVRLPYGDYDDHSINAVRSIGMEPIQWDVEPSVT